METFLFCTFLLWLGVALEKMKVPENITVICIVKYICQIRNYIGTPPAEAGWEGHLTLEFSNSSGADCRIYANEGICQLLFFEAILALQRMEIEKVNIKSTREGNFVKI